jgi:hypothetical protein
MQLTSAGWMAPMLSRTSAISRALDQASQGLINSERTLVSRTIT